MKRTLSLLLALCLALGGCAAREPDWRFTLDTRHDADDYTARSGMLLAWYAYELPILAIEGGEPPEAALAVRDAFNAEVEYRRALLLEEYEQMRLLAIDDYSARNETEREGFRPLGNQMEIAGTYQTARLLSVRMEGCADWGGAHPLGFTRVWNFDLETGRFVDWTDLTDKTDALRAAMVKSVQTQMAERDESWYEGAEEAAERLEGCEVCFGDDGMVLIFDAQVLSPRAAEFTVPYTAVMRYFNAYGKALVK